MPQPPRFNWKTADGASHEFEMNATEIAIGRAPTCDIVLNDDQMVSRRHAIVRRQGTTVTVVDLGSSNGTLVNGNEIHDVTTLHDGDRLTIGDHDLMFTAAREGAQPSVPVAPGAPVVETIRIGGAPASQPAASFAGAMSAPVPPPPLTPSPAYAGAASGPSSSFGGASSTYTGTPSASPYSPPASAYMSPALVEPEDVVVASFAPAPAFTEQDTSAIGFAAGQAQSSYVHIVNGKEVEREEAASSYQGQMVAESATPQRTDAVALLAQIQSLHTQLNAQIEDADHMADVVRDRVRGTLAQLDSALRAAQAGPQLTAISDLRQLADGVSQNQQIDQVANFARRASEMRDVLSAHQALLTVLESIRQQLQDAIGK
jgi:hypothetical protein